jgi:26S proteasome regulatory subunit N3
MSAHSTAVVRHDAVGQETLLNLLLRNYLHYNLYDQVGRSFVLFMGVWQRE